MTGHRKSLHDRAVAQMERLRETTGLNYSDFARQVLGVSPSAVYSWRTGGTQMAEVSALFLLRILTVTVTDEEIILVLRHAAKGPRFSGRKRSR